MPRVGPKTHEAMPEPKPNAWESSEYTWRCTCGAALGFGFDHTYDEVYPDAQLHAQANPTHRVFLGRKQERWVIPSATEAEVKP